jgi:endonuclease/exonuclease/phosphatase family metal-dependent hydrolase
MVQWMVTTNVGGGFGGAARHAGMIAWAREAVQRSPALVFAQEVPATGWLDLWESAGYSVTLGPDHGWKVRSALLSRQDLPVTTIELANADYHGSYVAGAQVTTRSGPVIALSVHASPKEAAPEQYGWQGQLPEARHGGDDARYRSRVLWDSDLVLSTIESAAQRGLPLIAAGDLNEAQAYDVDSTTGVTGTWGREYFARVSRSGLVEHLSTSWGGERATRAVLQLDRVIVNAQGRGLLANEAPSIDPAWAGEDAATHLSDHAAVWVPLVDDIWRP